MGTPRAAPWAALGDITITLGVFVLSFCYFRSSSNFGESKEQTAIVFFLIRISCLTKVSSADTSNLSWHFEFCDAMMIKYDDYSVYKTIMFTIEYICI